MTVDVREGDCLDLLRQMPEGSVDSIVTDPPYGLEFMGQGWDSDVPPVAVWAECLRVLKPGGHLLAFAGTRTQHRMATRIEDAGFEVRDLMMWVYGSGFPKSLDVSKAIDKAAGASGTYGGPKSVAHAGWIDRGRMRGADGEEGWQRPWMTDGDAVDRAAREYLPATEAAQAFKGWGTALKPALEPITVARKPLAGTVAANVLAHGTGALNIDGCRIAHASADDLAISQAKNPGRTDTVTSGVYGADRPQQSVNVEGRWPANLIHDGSEEVVALFPQSDARDGKTKGHGMGFHGGAAQDRAPLAVRSDSGSAARFFYCAKASRSERGEGNTHPTVKPLALMRYLVRLVTPPGGLVLDPFAGSGTTGLAAQAEGMRAVLMEMDAGHAGIARARIAAEAGLFAWSAE